MDSNHKPDEPSLPFVTASSLWPPRLVSELSAWNQHIPFAGWIIEATQPKVFVELGTHAAPSYFAFCETASRLEIGTSCFAVDTWLGDEHAGFYGEEIYQSVRKTNSQLYESFSRLLRMTFDEAVDQFEDGSIDLLHIDGLHTYEAVRHDFDAWRPKLSDQGVVLLHDTNERKGDFGVHRLLTELRSEYPVFEFTHGHGLGVVCVGDNPPVSVLDLVALEEDPRQLARYRSIYEALGRKLEAEHQAAQLRASLKQKERENSRMSELLSQRSEKLSQYAATVAKRDRKVENLQVAVAQKNEKLNKYVATVAKRDKKLADLESSVARQTEQVTDLGNQLRQRERDNTRLERLTVERTERTNHLETELSQRTSELEKRKAELTKATQRAKKATRSLDRLQSRRSVRLALGISKLFRPLFQLVRKAKKAVRRPVQAAPIAGAEPQIDQSTLQKPTVQPPLPVPPGVGSEHGPVTIVIPVFNAHDELVRCLESVKRNTAGDCELLVIDDASTDERIAPLLERWAHRDNVTVLTNEENLGFVGTVNRGFGATEGDVVLLNSDVEVTPGWMNRLRIAARKVPKAGTITPLSNNAGAFSAPVLGEENATPPFISRDATGRLVAQRAKRSYPEGPTGNGFCMYVRRACIDDVGVFDADAFPRGYGEENDFCMRALAKGWTHIVDDSTYVFHQRSASFGSEKQELAAAGRRVLDERYPEYTGLVREFVNSSPLAGARELVDKVFREAASRPPPRPRLLFVLHDATGGTPATTGDLAKGLEDSYEAFSLVSNGSLLRLNRLVGGETEEIQRWSLRDKIQVTDRTNPDYRSIVHSILTDHAIDLVHIRHLIGHTFELAAIAGSLDLPVVLSFHDFYYVCPTVHLMDDNDRFCGGLCSPGQGECQTPTPWLAGLPHLKHSWVYDWRDRAIDLFSNVDAFITASDSARNTYYRAFPELRDRFFPVIEHGRELDVAASPAGQEPVPGGRIRILLPGNVGPHKGSQLIRDLVDLDHSKRLEFHFLGRASGDLQPVGTHHGTYDREEFELRARAIAPSFAGVLSTTAESFSHTLTESWAAGIPVLASDLGALKDRIERHGGGWLIDIDDAETAYAQIVAAADDPDEYRKQRELAQQAAIDAHSIEEMAGEYGAVYARLIAEKRTFASTAEDDAAASGRLRVAAFIPAGSADVAKPPAHIRVLRRLGDATIAGQVNWDVADIDEFIGGAVPRSPIDVALVHRTAIPPELSDQFLSRCKDLGVGIALDLDDDLLSTDESWAEAEHYAAYHQSLESLLAEAGVVTASTSTLANQLGGHSSNIVVIENALDRELWFRPLRSAKASRGSEAIVRPASGARLLFAGGMSHRDDLAIVRSGIEMARAKTGREYEPYVIGGAKPEDRESWYTPIPVPSGHAYYPRFVQWLRALAPHFDIGLAPLEDTAVNRSKSDLRFLEYAAIGLPGIYSAGPAFDSVEDSVTGLRVANTAEEWSDAIIRLSTDDELAAGIRRASADYLMGNRLVDTRAEEYVSALQAARTVRVLQGE